MLSKFNRIRRDSSILPALGQVMLMANFMFKIRNSVTQAARLTEKTRQVTAERYQELPRRHVLYRLNWTNRFVTRLSYQSKCIGGERCILRICMCANRVFAGIYFPPELDRENIKELQISVLHKLLILAHNY